MAQALLKQSGSHKESKITNDVEFSTQFKDYPKTRSKEYGRSQTERYRRKTTAEKGFEIRRKWSLTAKGERKGEEEEEVPPKGQKEQTSPTERKRPTIKDRFMSLYKSRASDEQTEPAMEPTSAFDKSKQRLDQRYEDLSKLKTTAQEMNNEAMDFGKLAERLQEKHKQKK